MRTRKELNDLVKKYNLVDKIKAKYGKHWTNCTSVQLEEMVNNHIKTTNKKPTKTPSKETNSVCKNTTENVMNNNIHSKFAKLVEILGRHRILLPSEIDDICKS